jgi:hypothetical protein
MADYYREAREAKKALKDVAEGNKKRRETRRELGMEDDGVEHPLSERHVQTLFLECLFISHQSTQTI